VGWHLRSAALFFRRHAPHVTRALPGVSAGAGPPDDNASYYRLSDGGRFCLPTILQSCLIQITACEKLAWQLQIDDCPFAKYKSTSKSNTNNSQKVLPKLYLGNN
jgi:hypothetical protein